LIYASAYKAITAYQPQRATQQRIASKPPAPKPVHNKSAPPLITDLNHINQAARRMLPPDKRGPNPHWLVHTIVTNGGQRAVERFS